MLFLISIGVIAIVAIVVILALASKFKNIRKGAMNHTVRNNGMTNHKKEQYMETLVAILLIVALVIAFAYFANKFKEEQTETVSVNLDTETNGYDNI